MRSTFLSLGLGSRRESISLQEQCRRLSSASASHTPLPPEFRDIFIVDHSFPLKEWLSQPVNKPADAYRNIVHPHSKHVVSSYAQYFYSHQKYNYNDLGEFSLNLMAAELLNSISEPKEGHSVVLWPEKVLLGNLHPSDIPKLSAYLLNKHSTLSDLHNLPLSSSAHIQSLTIAIDSVLVLTQINPSHSLSQALQTIAWLEQAQKEIETTHSTHSSVNTSKKINYGIGVSAGARHRSGGNVLLLPYGDSFEAVWSYQQAKKILKACQSP